MSALTIFLVLVALIGGSGLAAFFLSRRLRMQEYNWKLGLIFFTAAAALVINQSNDWTPRLGIDLRGGAILEYRVDQDRKSSDTVNMDEVISALSRRLNPGGVLEITIRASGPERIEIILPEADREELQRVTNLLDKVGSLEFRIVAHPSFNADIIALAHESPGKVVLDENGKKIARWVPVARDRKDPKQFVLDLSEYMRSEQPTRNPGRFTPSGDAELLVIYGPYNPSEDGDPKGVTGEFLSSVRAGQDERGFPAINFSFDSQGAYWFSQLTGDHLPQGGVKRQLAIVLDDRLESAPSINSQISDSGIIEGRFTLEEVNDMVAVLKSGALPTALEKKPLRSDLVGPTLGADTIRAGSLAITFSMVAVLIFMGIYYRFAGVVACVALLLTLIFLLALMISFKAVFTLPGLAGLVLTVGMAVDANVLIYERIREELDRGATLRMAIRNGFSRATVTIVDANLTTLITATILYWIGTDQIRGFAVTLWLGIVLSMFTAIFIARVLFDIAERARYLKELKMLRLIGSPSFDWLAHRRTAFIGSLVVICVGMIGLVARQMDNSLLDIDFTGGVSVTVQFDKEQSTAEVRKLATDSLPDLLVMDLQTSDRPNRLFKLDTSLRDEDKTKELLKKAFKGMLAHNSVKIAKLEPVKPAAPGTPPAQPAGADGKTSFVPTRIEAGDLAVALPLNAIGALAQDESQADDKSKADDKQAPPKTAEPTAKSADKTDTTKTDTGKTDTGKTDTGKAAGKTEPATGTQPPAVTEPAAGTDTEPIGPEAPVTGEEPAPAAPSRTRAELEFTTEIGRLTLESKLSDQFKKMNLGDGKNLMSIDKLEVKEGLESQRAMKWLVTFTLDQQQCNQLLQSFKADLEQDPFFPSSSKVGGAVANDTQVLAMIAMLASLLAIVAYIWFRFSKVMFGLAAVVALVHDVLVTLGFLALSLYVADFLGFLQIEPFKINLNIVAALLTVIGYSLNDTIVVFDRVREIRGKSPQLTGEMINKSINQTLARTMLTSGTTLLVVAILYFLGGAGIHGFAFALMVGVIVGTYSSIFVACPTLLWLAEGQAKASSPAAKPSKTARVGSA